MLTTSSAPGPGRCFPFWQEVLACYVVNTSSEDVSGQAKCKPVLEDYYECLHHKKEASLTFSTPWRDILPAQAEQTRDMIYQRDWR